MVPHPSRSRLVLAACLFSLLPLPGISQTRAELERHLFEIDQALVQAIRQSQDAREKGADAQEIARLDKHLDLLESTRSFAQKQLEAGPPPLPKAPKKAEAPRPHPWRKPKPAKAPAPAPKDAEIQAGMAAMISSSELLPRSGKNDLDANQANLGADAKVRKDAPEFFSKAGSFSFARGSAELPSGAKAYLLKLARYLKKNPKMPIRLEGHSDHSQIETIDGGISSRRAEAFRQRLKQLGVKASQMQIRGLGSSMPKRTEGSDKAQAKNRRVEVLALVSN